MPIERGTRYRGSPPPGTAPGVGGSSSGTTTRGKPLGVEEGYSTTVRRSWTPSPGRSGRVDTSALGYTANQGPRYFQNDQFRLAAAPPQQIVRIQRQMWDAGLYDGPIDHVGVWSGNTVKAYKKLLEYANQSGLSADQALVQMKRGAVAGGTAGGMGGGEGGGGGAGDVIGYDPQGNPIYAPGEQFIPPALELQLPNKMELEGVVRKSVIENLGVGWSREEVSRVADSIIAQYRTSQTNAYNQQVENLEAEFYGQEAPNPVIESVDVASPEALVEEEARRRDPGGVQATDIAEDYAPAFFNALGGYT